MRDDYIRRQEEKIKKRLWELFSLKSFSLFAICLLSLAILCSWDPPPQMWRSENITIIDMEYRDRPTFLSEHPDPGYKLTDQNGNLYWIDEDVDGLLVGESYSIRYVDRGYYRFFRSVIQGDNILIDYNDSVSQWHRDSQLGVLVLIVFLLSLLGIIRTAGRMLSDTEIQQCKEKIQKHRQK